jgi:hypothetical protein
VLAIAWLVWQSGSELVDIFRSASFAWLFLAFVLWVGSNFLSPLISLQLFRAHQSRNSFGELRHIHNRNLPAKYLPGGIWHSVGRANDYLLTGIPAGKLPGFFVSENFLLVAVTLGISSSIVAGLQDNALFAGILYATSLLLLPLILVYPRLLKFVAGLLKRDVVTLHYPAWLYSVLMMVLYWTVISLSFSAYVTAFAAAPDLDMISSAAIYMFSWCIGYISVFAPQGIGVMESVAAFLMSGDTATLIGFLFGFRLLVLLSDLSSWLINFFIHLSTNGQHENTD